MATRQKSQNNDRIIILTNALEPQGALQVYNLITLLSNIFLSFLSFLPSFYIRYVRFYSVPPLPDVIYIWSMLYNLITKVMYSMTCIKLELVELKGLMTTEVDFITRDKRTRNK